MTDVPKTADALALIDSKNPATWLCKHYQPQIEEALNYSLVRVGKHDLPLTFEPFAAAAREEVLNDLATHREKPDEAFLARAFRDAPETAIAALVFAAQCKLLVGRRYGLVWLIPRRNQGRWEVQAQLGYKGLCAMGKRHPRVHSIEAFLVYEGEQDDFGFDAGSGKLRHKVNLMCDRSDSKIVGGYAKCIITEESSHHAVIDAPLYWPMSISEINKRRDNSDGFKKGGASSPWRKWYPEMCRKTLLIGLLNHGSVPLDMGTSGMLERDAEGDAEKSAAETCPAMPTRASEARQRLGIEVGSSGSAEVEIGDPEPFESAEHAVAWIAKATADQLDDPDLPRRTTHLVGIDRETVVDAIARRYAELES